MANIDREVKALAYARDRVEALAYKLRDEASGGLKPYIDPKTHQQFLDTVTNTTYWIEDEDPDEPYTLKAFDGKFEDLRMLALPAQNRRAQDANRPDAVMGLKKRCR